MTNLEKQYLKNIDDDKIKSKIKAKKDKLGSFFNYDPRKDTDFFNDLGTKLGINIDFSDFSDKDIKEMRYSIIYDELLDDEDIEDFEKIYNEDLKWKEGEHKGYYKAWDDITI